MMAYTIEAYQESKLFYGIFASAQFEEYSKIARDFGANVPFLRREELSTATVSS